jgi:hypothetical protein
MQYQFAEPFIVDSTRITDQLGVHPTPLDQALATTMGSYTADSATIQTAL